jgi:uncharacterized protein
MAGMTILGYALAVVIGLSLGLLGGGGSILTVPVLIYVLGYGVKTAVPMSLVVVGATSLVGVVTHWRGGTLNLRAALAFAPPAIVGALLGANLGLGADPRLQLTLFAIVMLVAAVSMFFRRPERAEGPRPAARLPFITLVGAGVGVLTGFVGVGGGFVYVPALVMLGGLAMKEAVGTSLALIAVSCAAGLAMYQGRTTLDWGAVALFTALALVGVVAGSRLVRFVRPDQLRRGFAVFLLFMGAIVLLRGR